MPNINDYGLPFTSQDGDRKYSALEWREYFSRLIHNGLIQNAANECQVKPQAAPNKTVYVDTGVVFINGAMRVLEEPVTLTVAENTSGNPRIDRVVARLNEASRTIEFDVLEGTPAGSPAAPALTRTEGVYELGLADLTLANGYSTITATEITDQRWDISLCGASSMTIGVIPPSGMEAQTVTLSAETAGAYSSQNVDDALFKIYEDINLTASLSAFNAFCTNANANSLDSAFGKNRLDSEVRGLGIALALYAYFKGDSRITHPFTELKTVNNMTELINNPTALAELYYCDNLFALTELSPYAKGILDVTNIYPIIAASAGVSNPLSFTTADSIATNDIAVNSISSSVRALYITGKVVRLRPIWSNATFVSKMFSKTAFIDNIFEAPLTAIYEPLMTSISAISTYIVSKKVSEVVASQVTKVLANNKVFFISITAGGGTNAGSGVIVGYFPVGTSTQTKTVGSGTQITVAVNKLASTPYISNLSGASHTSNTQWTNFPIPL